MLSFWTKGKRLCKKFDVSMGHAISVLHVFKGNYDRAEQHFMNMNKER